MDNISSYLKQFYFKQINAGVKEEESSLRCKTARKANFYNYITLLFYTFLIIINILDKNYFFVRIASIQFLVFLTNHICFRFHKRITLYTFLFVFFFTASTMSGLFHGAGLVILGLYILTVVNLLGLRIGTPLTFLMIVLEVLIHYFGKGFEWIYSYSSTNNLMFIRLVASHVGIYLFSYYHLKLQKESYNELKEEKESRKQLFLNIVHDLKTPLTIIHNSVDVCEKEFRNTPSISLLKSSILKMEKNILNILNIEKLERGFPIAEIDSVTNVSEVTWETYELYSKNVCPDNLSIVCDIDKEIFARIDEISYIQILNNLVDNALKYSKGEGTIYISLSKIMGKVCLSVKDEGIGISEDDAKRIFEPYYQGHQGYSSYYGLGIGLALVKEICEAFNGSITLASCLGEGSSFTVTLPVAEKPKEVTQTNIKREVVIPEIKKPLITSKNNPQNKTILIVENNLDIMDLLVKNLDSDYNVITASNGVEGLRRINDGSLIDLIITDIMMPEMDGKEFVKKLHNDKLNRKIPVIFLTAKAGSDEIIDYLSLGAVDYICKPFDVNELKIKVQSIFQVFEHMQDSIVADIEDSLQSFVLSNTKPVNTSEVKRFKFRDYNISPKEESIIKELSEGLSHKEIAYNQGISVNTVKSHIQRIYKKCKVQNSTSLLKLFFYNIK